MDFLDNVGNFIQTGLNSPMLIPSLATAAQQWQQAGQYQDLGNQAADRADPFGQYRRGYGDQLQALYQDPSKINQTPGYKFAMNEAMNSTASKLASQGFLGSSQMQQALVDRSSGLAQQTWDKEANRLAMMAGAQFDPANAARMQMEGGKLKMDAQSNALGALMYPFGPSAGPGGGSGGGGSGGVGQWGNPFKADGAATSAIMQGGQLGWQAASKLLDQGIRFVSLPDGSTADLQQYMMHGADNGDGNTTPYYPTGSAAGYTNDPNSQFYQPPPEDPNNEQYPGYYGPPTPTMPDDSYGYVPGGSNGGWDVSGGDGYNFDISGGYE